MIKEYKHIEIVRSSTVALSSMSRASAAAIFEVLSAKYSNVGITVINSVSDLETLLDKDIDLVFLGVEFIPTSPTLGVADPDKVWVGDFLDAHNISYTGSNSAAHQLQRHKDLAKQRVLDSGLNTSAFYVVKRGATFTEADLKIAFPLFIKPLNRGGGYGIDSGSVVHDFKQLHERINFITSEIGSDSLIEQYLTGREFSVAVLKDRYTGKHSAMPVELIAPENEHGARLLSEAIKSSNTDQAIAVVDKYLSNLVCNFALDVFSALGARDYGRIDIRLDSFGTPQFLEANLIPSLIDGYGSFPKACDINEDLQYKDMIYQIVDLALLRSDENAGVLAGVKALELIPFPETVMLKPV